MADRVTVTLHMLVSAMDTYADALLKGRFGVTYNLFEFLAKVSELDTPDVTTLARHLRNSKAAVSKRVPGLRADGWIETVSDPANARRVRIALTDKGADLVRDAGGVLDAEFTDLFADADLIDPAVLNSQLETLFRLMERKELPQ